METESDLLSANVIDVGACHKDFQMNSPITASLRGSISLARL